MYPYNKNPHKYIYNIELFAERNIIQHFKILSHQVAKL